MAIGTTSYNVSRIYSDQESEYIPNEVIRDGMLSKLFDARGDLVKTLDDGKRHVIKITDYEEWDSIYGLLAKRHTIRCEHAHVPTRVFVETQLVVDDLSVGELWREFCERVNRKRKRLGVGFIANEFLEQLERMQGWATSND